jgi:hypothetical protein
VDPKLRLSTSSFKRRFAWIFFPAILLLTGYGAAIHFGLITPTDGIQLRDKNWIKCESYLLDRSIRPEVVLIGSSLTANLPSEVMSKDVFNLGLGGDSAWTGLEIIRSRTDYRPRLIVVEASDLLLRDANHEFLRSLLNPMWLAVRRALPILRREYQPTGVLLKQVARWNNHQTTEKPDANSPNFFSITTRLLEQARITADAGLTQVESKDLRMACARLRALMADLQKDGIRCVLQHVPGDSFLADSLRSRELVTLLNQEFPATHCMWVSPPDDYRGRTRDAVHLVKEDAANYARYLNSMVVQ